MAFFTEIGKKYNVTGVMGGWDNYTPAIPDDEHARGESTGTAVLQLKGKQIEVTSHEHRVEEGYPANQGEPYAPYEVVKVKEVGGDETEYYAWVVYNGDINVEEIVEQEDPPDPPDPVTDPDPPIDPPKPDEDIITNGTEVHVRAGETMVLELETEGEKADEEEQHDEVGSIEVELVDEAGNPYTDSEIVHLLGEKSIYTVPVDKKTGIGSRADIEPGEYELALELGTVYFEQNKDVLTVAEQNKLSGITNKLAQSKIDFESIRCIGYADNDGSQKYNENLCLKRAIHIKNQLILTQSKISKSKILTGVGGVLKGESEEERKESRKVKIFALIST